MQALLVSSLNMKLKVEPPHELSTRLSPAEKQLPPDFKPSNNDDVPKRGFLPTRLYVGLMLLVSMIMLYSMRANMSISVLAIAATEGSRWSMYEQSLVLSAFAAGYFLTLVPLGALADRYGMARWIIGAPVLASSLLTLATPAAAAHSVEMVLCLRFAMGFISAGIVTAGQNLITAWSPPNEKSRFVGVYFGVDIGTLLTLLLGGVIIDTLGWQWTFYGNGAVGVLASALWFLCVYNTPAEHPRISGAEREYIVNAQRAVLSSKQEATAEKRWPPFGEILLSSAFWALMIGQYAQISGQIFLMVGAPRFLHDVLGFEFSLCGLILGATFLVRPIMGLAFAAVADWLLGSERLTREDVRKGFVVFSHILTGICFLMIGLLHRSGDAPAPWLCVACIFASSVFNASVVVTTVQNHLDLAPNFAASLMAIICMVASTSGFVIPVLIAFVTGETNGMDEWVLLFGILGAVYIVAGLLFILLSSVQEQSWNVRQNI